MNLDKLGIDTEIVKETDIETDFYDEPKYYPPPEPETEDFWQETEAPEETESDEPTEEHSSGSDGHLKKSSFRIVSTFDNVVAWALSKFIAGNNKPERYRLSKSDRLQLADAISELIPNQVEKVGPGMQLAFLAFSLYYNQYDKAAQDGIIEAQKQEINELKRQLELEKIRDEQKKYRIVEQQPEDNIPESSTGD